MQHNTQIVSLKGNFTGCIFTYGTWLMLKKLNWMSSNIFIQHTLTIFCAMNDTSYDMLTLKEKKFYNKGLLSQNFAAFHYTLSNFPGL